MRRGGGIATAGVGGYLGGGELFDDAALGGEGGDEQQIVHEVHVTRHRLLAFLCDVLQWTLAH